MQQTDQSTVEPPLRRGPSFFSKILNRSIQKVQKSIDNVLGSRRKYLYIIIVVNVIWNTALILGGFGLAATSNIPGALAATLLLLFGKFKSVKLQTITNWMFYVAVSKVVIFAGLVIFCMTLVIIYRENDAKAMKWGIRAFWYIGCVLLDMVLMFLYTNVTLLSDVYIDLIKQREFYELRDMTKDDSKLDATKMLDITKSGDKSTMDKSIDV